MPSTTRGDAKYSETSSSSRAKQSSGDVGGQIVAVGNSKKTKSEGTSKNTSKPEENASNLSSSKANDKPHKTQNTNSIESRKHPTPPKVDQTPISTKKYASLKFKKNKHASTPPAMAEGTSPRLQTIETDPSSPSLLVEAVEAPQAVANLDSTGLFESLPFSSPERLENDAPVAEKLSYVESHTHWPDEGNSTMLHAPNASNLSSSKANGQPQKTQNTNSIESRQHPSPPKVDQTPISTKKYASLKFKKNKHASTPPAMAEGTSPRLQTIETDPSSPSLLVEAVEAPQAVANLDSTGLFESLPFSSPERLENDAPVAEKLSYVESHTHWPDEGNPTMLHAPSTLDSTAISYFHQASSAVLPSTEVPTIPDVVMASPEQTHSVVTPPAPVPQLDSGTNGGRPGDLQDEPTRLDLLAKDHPSSYPSEGSLPHNASSANPEGLHLKPKLPPRRSGKKPKSAKRTASDSADVQIKTIELSSNPDSLIPFEGQTLNVEDAQSDKPGDAVGQPPTPRPKGRKKRKEIQSLSADVETSPDKILPVAEVAKQAESPRKKGGRKKKAEMDTDNTTVLAVEPSQSKTKTAKPTKAKAIKPATVPKVKRVRGTAISSLGKKQLGKGEPQWKLCKLPPSDISKHIQSHITDHPQLQPSIWCSGKEELISALPELAKTINGIAWLLSTTPVMFLEDSSNEVVASELVGDDLAFDLTIVRDFLCLSTDLISYADSLENSKVAVSNVSTSHGLQKDRIEPGVELYILSEDTARNLPEAIYPRSPRNDELNFDAGLSEQHGEYQFCLPKTELAGSTTARHSTSFQLGSIPLNASSRDCICSRYRFDPECNHQCGTQTYAQRDEDHHTTPVDATQQELSAITRDEDGQPVITARKGKRRAKEPGPQVMEKKLKRPRLGLDAETHLDTAGLSQSNQVSSPVTLGSHHGDSSTAPGPSRLQDYDGTQAAPMLTDSHAPTSFQRPISNTVDGPIMGYDMSIPLTSRGPNTQTIYETSPIHSVHPQPWVSPDTERLHDAHAHGYGHGHVQPPQIAVPPQAITSGSVPVPPEPSQSQSFASASQVSEVTTPTMTPDSRVPCKFPPEVTALCEAYTSSTPITVIASRTFLERRWKVHVPKECAYAYAGFFVLDSVQERRVHDSDGSGSGTSRVGVDEEVVSGRMEWRFRCRWVPSGEEYDAYKYRNVDVNANPTPTPIDPRPWWSPSPPNPAQSLLNTSSTPGSDPSSTSLLTSTSTSTSTSQRHLSLRLKHPNYPLLGAPPPHEFPHRLAFHWLLPDTIRCGLSGDVDGGLPSGWHCEQCGRVNFRALLRHTECVFCTKGRVGANGAVASRLLSEKDDDRGKGKGKGKKGKGKAQGNGKGKERATEDVPTPIANGKSDGGAGDEAEAEEGRGSDVGRGRPVPLYYLRDPQQSGPMSHPTNVVPLGPGSSIDGARIDFRDGTVCFEYSWANGGVVGEGHGGLGEGSGSGSGVVVSHVFLGNTPALQRDATQLLEDIQLWVPLRRQMCSPSPYFTYTTPPAPEVWIPCMERARDAMTVRAREYAEREDVSIDKIEACAWVVPGKRKGLSPLDARATPAVLMVLGCEVAVTLVPKAGLPVVSESSVAVDPGPSSTATEVAGELLTLPRTLAEETGDVDVDALAGDVVERMPSAIAEATATRTADGDAVMQVGIEPMSLPLSMAETGKGDAAAVEAEMSTAEKTGDVDMDAVMEVAVEPLPPSTAEKTSNVGAVVSVKEEAGVMESLMEMRLLAPGEGVEDVMEVDDLMEQEDAHAEMDVDAPDAPVDPSAAGEGVEEVTVSPKSKSSGKKAKALEVRPRKLPKAKVSDPTVMITLVHGDMLVLFGDIFELFVDDDSVFT
ncbi:hypothetical protein H0H92_009684 [Tricholoma furcatifolium]|nr:hypothetical protein H0H92_009684 [Tricholoma furcatifolium]